MEKEDQTDEICAAILRAAADAQIGVKRIHISRGKKVRIMLDDGTELFRTTSQILSDPTENLFEGMEG